VSAAGGSERQARPISGGASPTFADVNRDVLRTLEFPGPTYFAWMSLIALILAGGIACWTLQVYFGMGMAGKRNPQMWAMYITTFVFWIGIGHAGTLISAILYLFRAKWRTSIYRGSEAMTIFAVMTAGLFPIIHAGRMWLAYWLVPYPNERFLWPNFRSPLVWDVFAISTYLTISAVFFIVGLVPDIAALATPLVVSVHSVVSWDFAMALVPGWHSTLFAPFFVDGAIFSGFAMVLVLLIPMRHYFNLYAYITDRHLDNMAKLILVTGLVLTYFYACEGFTAWYSGEPMERASYLFKWVGVYAPWWWLQIFCNSVAPLVFFSKRARTHIPTLYVVSILVLIGMWFERFNIIVPGLAHGFYPYTFGSYIPTPVDTGIIIGSFAWFFILFLAFIKVMPSMSIVEVKETIPHPVRDGHAH
jgi:Ni/Fe-hydrogenase subunit HybB-like protein